MNYNAYTASGTVTVTVPYAKAVLDSEYMSRLFPIRWGAQGSQPNLPVLGDDYCEYHFTIRGLEDVQDVDGANHYNEYEKEVYFYVRANDPNFAAFDTAIRPLSLCSRLFNMIVLIGLPNLYPGLPPKA